MKVFEIYGDPSLTQWDVGRRLIVNEWCSSVHFAHKNSQEALVCAVEETDGVRLVRIPDELLQKDEDLWAYAFVARDGGYTKAIQFFAVKSKPKPANYVYTPTEAMTWEGLHERISALEENGGTAGADGYSVLFLDDVTMGLASYQAAVSRMVLPDGYVPKAGEQVLTKDGYLYTLEAISDTPDGSYAQLALLSTLAGPQGEMGVGITTITIEEV